MISAIIEILLLLIVSCLIGIFFTYRFWKSKYLLLQEQNDQLQKANEGLNKTTEHLKSKNEGLALEVAGLQKDVESEKSRLRKLEKETKKLKLELEKKKVAPVKKPRTSAEDKKLLKTLKSDLDLLKEEIEERDREIDVLSVELETRKISYYKQIDGRRYKAITLQMADESVAGQGDGRISIEDAKKIFSTISDGKAYTRVEKDTMRYLRDHYKWTDGADELFRRKVRSWAAKDHQLN